MKIKKINVCREFSSLAFGRDAKDGPNSGERFRNEFLIPIWNDYDQIEVDFSGFMASPGSSFLSASFAELVSRCGIPYDEVKDKIKILPIDSVYPASVEYLLNLAVKKG